jgi:hypothetical protein
MSTRVVRPRRGSVERGHAPGPRVA